MAVHDFTSERLFVDCSLAEGIQVACAPEQVNYLRNVLRLKTGDQLLIFNGRDGEWLAAVVEAGKRSCVLEAKRQTRPQSGGPDIHYLFAPLKRARLDYMVQKATELGVARLSPVLTRHTIADRVNLDRVRANAIEAAEQCGILRIPDVTAPRKLTHVLDSWDAERCLVFCDEGAPMTDSIAQLRTVQRGPIAVLVGPEGGFSDDERTCICEKSYSVPISLGPRIMRADTAAVAALALVNAVLGDWQ